MPKTYLETMKSSPKYKWFKPLLALILFGVFYFLLVIILAVKTEGLEVTTVLHSANNVTAMAMSTVFVSATVTKTTTLTAFAFDTTGTLVAAAVAYYLCKRFGYIKSK